MHQIYDFTASDTGAKIRVGFINGSTGKRLVPFSGVYNADLRVKAQDADTFTRAMTVLSGDDDGFAEYQFLPGELVEGQTEIQAVITKVSDATFVSELGTKLYRVGPQL